MGDVHFLGRLANGLPDWLPDVYYSPAYGATAEILDGGTWECALIPGLGAYSYIRRDVGEGGEYDIVTPYGYAGPILEPGQPQDALSELRQTFLKGSRERGLVAEFVRGNPFDLDEKSVARLDADRVRWHPTLAIRRSENPEQYFSEAEGRHRTAVRKALKSQLVVRDVPVATLVEPTSDFRRIYLETMERVGASARLRMGNDYYQALVDGLNERLTVLLVDGPNGVAAAGIFMHWNERWHYHLSGSSPEGMRLGASNLMIDHVVRALMAPDQVLHLGGGVTAGDGLEGFKASMANRRYGVPLCSSVVNAARYDELVALADKSDSAYFPAYRG